MPKLWSQTLEAHRHEVSGAILDAAAALVHERGLRAVTMLEIAEKTGIGRATLYKYFGDVEAILLAWYERHVGAHLARLEALRDAPDEPPARRLAAVLAGFAAIQREHQHVAPELHAILHRGAHHGRAQQHLAALLRGLLAECARAGVVRKDVAPEELATYCIHALGAAATLRSHAAVERLVAVTIGGLSRQT